METVVAEKTNTEAQALSILDNLVQVARSDKAQISELIIVLVEESLKGTVVWDKNFTNTVNKAVELINESVSNQISEILHNPSLQRLEGSWRGLLHLVKNTLCGPDLKIKLLDVDKDTLRLQNLGAPLRTLPSQKSLG